MNVLKELLRNSKNSFQNSMVIKIQARGQMGPTTQIKILTGILKQPILIDSTTLGPNDNVEG
jgi:hypothetical protein